MRNSSYFLGKDNIFINTVYIRHTLKQIFVPSTLKPSIVCKSKSIWPPNVGLLKFTNTETSLARGTGTGKSGIQGPHLQSSVALCIVQHLKCSWPTAYKGNCKQLLSKGEKQNLGLQISMPICRKSSLREYEGSTCVQKIVYLSPYCLNYT